MEKHKCKLCSKVFANGRALGGHMKAHLLLLQIPPKPQHHHHFAPAAADSSSTTSSSSLFFHDEEEVDVNKAHLTYTLRENPKKSRKLPDPDVHDGERETESKSPTRRRSKRKERRIAADPEPASSVSDTTSDEDAAATAMCLVMLSRDTWPNQVPKRHRCEICNKSFRSAQALGGHRVTHRKLDRPDKYRKKTVSAADDINSGNASYEGDGKVFECPYCYRVFASGQALGGHKRSHVMGPAAAATTPKTSVNLIDLNLPAPEEEDDGSVVSDTEIADQNRALMWTTINDQEIEIDCVPIHHQR